MAKLEELLKAEGYTDDELKELSPLLNNPKFRTSVERQAQIAEESGQKLTKAQQELDTWSKWHQETALPMLDKNMKEAIAARERAAALEERLKAAQEYGLAEVAKQEEKPVEKTSDVFDPKKHNLVTYDDVKTLADREGDSIALAQDIASEHHLLFGSRLPSFRELRKEAMAAGKPVEQYWQEKYKVQDKRNEISAKERADYEAKIRADERTKTISEIANPMTRPPSSSHSSFIPRANADNKQPWESGEDRTHARVEKALKSVLTQQVN